MPIKNHHRKVARSRLERSGPPPDNAHSAAVSPAEEQVFAHVVDLIHASRERDLSAVNSALPEHLGKLELYLEALDRDLRKPHERPSIGVLLCANKDNEVVKYALSRSLSPTLIAEYQTRLPDRKLLQAKLHEFYELTESATLPKSEHPIP